MPESIFHFLDERSGRKQEFFYEGGIRSFVSHLSKTKFAAFFQSQCTFEDTKNGVSMEVAMQYNESFSEAVYTFANNINTIEGGTHLSGFRTALTRVVNNYAASNGMFKSPKDKLDGEDVREGLTAIISIKIPEPQFEGQTKTKLGNSEVKGLVEQMLGEKLSVYFEENPQQSKVIINKGLEAQRARDAAKRARGFGAQKRRFGLHGSSGKISGLSK